MSSKMVFKSLLKTTPILLREMDAPTPIVKVKSTKTYTIISYKNN